MTSRQERAQQAFNEIRAIPYRVGTNAESTDKSNNCVHKNLMLAEKLITLGIPVRGRIGTMRWEDNPIPAEILALNPNTTTHEHFFLEVMDDGQNWRSIDCSIDPTLAKHGFPLLEWPTANAPALPCTHIFNPTEHDVYLLEKWHNPDYAQAYFSANGAFLRALNDWLNSLT